VRLHVGPSPLHILLVAPVRFHPRFHAVRLVSSSRPKSHDPTPLLIVTHCLTQHRHFLVFLRNFGSSQSRTLLHVFPFPDGGYLELDVHIPYRVHFFPLTLVPLSSDFTCIDHSSFHVPIWLFIPRYPSLSTPSVPLSCAAAASLTIINM